MIDKIRGKQLGANNYEIKLFPPQSKRDKGKEKASAKDWVFVFLLI
jgi:hypothetical protein